MPPPRQNKRRLFKSTSSERTMKTPGALGTRLLFCFKFSFTFLLHCLIGAEIYPCSSCRFCFREQGMMIWGSNFKLIWTFSPWVRGRSPYKQTFINSDFRNISHLTLLEGLPGRQEEFQFHGNQRRDHTAPVAISQAVLNIIFSGDQELIEECQKIHTADSQT